MRMVPSTLIAVALLAVTPADVSAMKVDYAHWKSQGQEMRYAWIPPGDTQTAPALKVMAIVSSRAAVLDNAVPSQVDGTNLIRLNLTALEWEVDSWVKVCGFKNNPTTPHENPLSVSGQWFLHELANGQESGGAYMTLLFGKKQPKTVDEFLAAFGINRKKQAGLAYGVIPQSSGVNNASNASRLLENSDGVHAEAWLTFDTLKVEPGKDPLEGLFADEFKYDGIEGYALRKAIITGPDGTPKRVTIPVPFLADSKQNIVFAAPAELVSDHTRLFGDEVIRAPSSCLTCHTEGSQPVNGNALVEALRRGVELRSYDYARQQQIEFYHLADIQEELERWDRGYADATDGINGLTPAETAACIKGAITSYRADLSLEDAAAQFSATPDELRNALAYASSKYIAIGARLSTLAHGEKIPRSQLEADWLKVQQYLKEWRTQ